MYKNIRDIYIKREVTKQYVINIYEKILKQGSPHLSMFIHAQMNIIINEVSYKILASLRNI